jgi:hypothetical protein
MIRRICAAACFASLASFALLARADESPTQKAARLFREANALADHGDFAGACPRFDESNKLDPGIGTEFNLADCYEHLGKTATALALFRDVEKIAGMAGKAERQNNARKRADGLEAVVGRIRVTVSAGGDAPGLELLCDDKAIDPAEFAHGLPVDAGSHVVIARAPLRVPWSQTVSVQDHESHNVTVPVLAAAGQAPASVIAPAPVIATPPAVIAPPKRRHPPSAPLPPPPPSTQKTAGYVLSAVGLAGIALGSATGILAIVEHGNYTTACGPSGASARCINPNGVSESDTAVAAGNVSTASFIVGGIALVAGVVLWATAPSTSDHTTGALPRPVRGGFVANGANLRWAW